MGDEDKKDFLSQNPNANTGIELRFFANNVEKDRVFKTQHYRPVHIRPGSTLVAPIGVMWEPGAWQKTVDMVMKTNEQGVCCWLHEMTDINAGIPAAHLNMMRDSACMYAHDAGFEWVLLLENDAMPEPDLLLKLLHWDMPVVVPYIMDNVLKKPICAPFYKKGSGLQPVQWAVFTCLLLNTKVLNCFPFTQPFNTIGIESGFFNKLRHYGHKSYQDTNTELEITRRPTYPVDYGGLEEEWKGWVRIDKKRRQIPDRKPISPDDENQVKGIYMPKSMASTFNREGGTDEKDSSGTQAKTGEGVSGTPTGNRETRRRTKKQKG